MERPTVIEYFMKITEDVSARSTCLRRRYGAVIVDPKTNRIIGTGYNGSARGAANCCDVGTCERASKNVPHGEQYEKCVAIHAEANAILQAGIMNTEGCYLYLAGFEDDKLIDARPCVMCERLIRTAKIDKVYARNADGTISSILIP